MNDITLEEMIASLSDTDLVTWWSAPTSNLPANYTTAEFLLKTLEACSLAAAAKNTTLEAGQKILGYPTAVNSPIETSKNGKLFFRRTASVTSFVVVNLDGAVAAVG